MSVRDHQPYLMFGKDGRMSGADGCSWLTAPYTVSATGITFGPIAETETVCSQSDSRSPQCNARQRIGRAASAAP
jgi:heat shock protein HslJ